jgi:hypothetical protein
VPQVAALGALGPKTLRQWNSTDVARFLHFALNMVGATAY